MESLGHCPRSTEPDLHVPLAPRRHGCTEVWEALDVPLQSPSLSTLNLIDAQLMPAPLGEDVSLCLVFYSLANQELRPCLGFCHSFLGQASSRWCSLPGKSNSGQFYPANNHPAQSPTVALTGGWSLPGSRRIRWFRMSMLGPALCASTENRSWDIVTLIHTHPSFCSECFYHWLPPLHHSNLTQMSPSQGHFLPDPLSIHPFSLSLPCFFLLQHLHILKMLIRYIFLICIYLSTK